MKIIVDSRERAVVSYFDSEIISVEQITVGDYAIMIDEKVVAVIERKTLDDYGASIRDGRAANKSKLVDFRNKTGARLFYVVEGDIFPADSTVYGGVKYSSIYSSILHLMTEYGICIWRTKSARESAKWISELAMSFVARPASETIGPDLYETNIHGAVETSHQSLLTMRQVKTLYDKRVQMWMGLDGIGPTIATVLANHVFMPLMQNIATLQTIKAADRLLSEPMKATILALTEMQWNKHQEAFIGSIMGIGKRKLGVLRGQYTSIRHICFVIHVARAKGLTLTGDLAMLAEMWCD